MESLRVPAATEEWQRASEEGGWGDGLPLVPPTKARVHEALAHTDRDPEATVAVLPPLGGLATVGKIATNAVMAGCPPALLPVVIAAVEAMASEEFNLGTIQTTTNPVTVAAIVCGPVVDGLAFNGAGNCLASGTVANATLGRAIRLTMTNLGGARGDLDAATHGQPGKYAFVTAENAEASPWPSLRRRLGHAESVSTVTVVGAAGTQNMLETTGDAAELIDAIARSVRAPTGNDYLFAGQPWIILAPEHARVLSAAGYGIDELRARLWTGSAIPLAEFSRSAIDYRLRNTWGDEDGRLTDDLLVPVSRRPEDIGLVVAGGRGAHSVFVPTIGLSRAATREIAA